MEKQDIRDYSSISPSAKALLLLKGLTAIPYAQEAAALVGDTGQDELSGREAPAFWGRVVHFESRYLSIDQLLQDQPAQHILELSSGFSFRGLVQTQRDHIHYIDTDLPEIISVKERFLEQLRPGTSGQGSRLELLPLNALEEPAFKAVAERFAEGPLAILNEGLLMYLNDAEKSRLCGIIREILLQRGGCWITADIYDRTEMERLGPQTDDRLSRFFEQHHIRDNMFESMEAAADFFRAQGFVIDAVAEPEPERISAVPKLMQYVPMDGETMLRHAGRMRATWRLKPVR